VALWATGTALLVAGGLWLARNRIADGVIADELASLGLPARYTIVSIGPGREVLANVVVGDPRRPDLVIERGAQPGLEPDRPAHRPDHAGAPAALRHCTTATPASARSTR
jgi:hypothetical protein